MKDFGTIQPYPANAYVFNVSNRNTRKRYDICSKLTIKKGINKHMSVKCLLHISQLVRPHSQMGRGHNMFNLQILLMLFPLCMCQIASLNVRVKNKRLKIMQRLLQRLLHCTFITIFYLQLAAAILRENS